MWDGGLRALLAHTVYLYQLVSKIADALGQRLGHIGEQLHQISCLFTTLESILDFAIVQPPRRCT
jgi:hypothetical protein